MTESVRRKFILSLACCSLAFGALLALTGCGGGGSEYAEPRVDSTDTRSKKVNQFLAGGDTLTRFLDLLEDTGMRDQLDYIGPWTVFVPENEAFQRAAYRLDTLFRSGNLDSLHKVMAFHIVRGRIDTSQVRDSLQIGTLYEKPLTLRRNGPRFTVMGANVTRYIPAQNGAIYIVDNVLELPPPDTSAQQQILFF